MSGRKPASKALAPRAKRALASRKVIRERMDKMREDAARIAGGLLLDRDDPDYNTDAEATKAQCSMRTWASLNIVNNLDAAERQQRSDDSATNRAFGVVMLQGKAKSRSEFDELVAQTKEPDAIEAEAVEVDDAAE